MAPSKLYLPMVYAVQMGGVCTLVGTSTNIVVADLYENATGRTMNMFSIFIPGMICLIVGVMFIVAVRRWLPSRVSPNEAFVTTLDYTVELLVPSDNPNICKRLGEAGLFHVKGGNLIDIRHYDHEPSLVSEDEYVMGGDRLVYTGQIDEILELKETHDLVVSDHHIRSMSEINKNYKLQIAFVNFDSCLIGETIAENGLEKDYHLILVAVARRGRRIEAPPREVKLQAGDTLLFECPRQTNVFTGDLASMLQFSDFQEVIKVSPVKVTLPKPAGFNFQTCSFILGARVTEEMRGVYESDYYAISIPRKGQDPHGVVIPSKWQWPTETTSITNAYPQFAAWAHDIKNPTYKNWYMSPEAGKVVNK